MRLIRSGAASLPPSTLCDLERTFGAPVIEAYGLTEAGPLIACNPLPPRARKPGSVGLAAGPEVAIMAPVGAVVSPGVEGEIVARGANIMAGYEGDDAANRDAFVGDWFRTGDLGYLDGDGYLFITGRAKEIINRGGQKVSPHEVEAALLGHPAVAHAAAFATPHPSLGEDVAAAVVLCANTTADAGALRAHAAARLAPYKVPRRVAIVDRIPVGATGKVRRVGLAEALGLAPHPYAPATTAAEARLIGLWEELLDTHPIGIRDDFFDLGGHSLLAARLVERIGETFGVDLPVSLLSRDATIERLATALGQQPSTPWPSLVAIQPHGSKPPFFCAHALFGDVVCYAELARSLGPDQPVYGLQAHGLDGVSAPLTRIAAMAARYIEELRAVRPTGPYYLGGYSSGAIIALEIAQQLCARGEEVALLALFDHARPGCDLLAARGALLPLHLLRNALVNLPYWLATFLRSSPDRRRALLRQRTRLTASTLAALSSGRGDRGVRPGFADLRAELEATPGLEYVARWPEHRFAVIQALHHALRDYAPAPYPGRIAVFRARRQPLLRAHRASMGWDDLAEGGVETYVTPGGHHSMLYRPYVRVLARKLASCLECAARD